MPGTLKKRLNKKALLIKTPYENRSRGNSFVPVTGSGLAWNLRISALLSGSNDQANIDLRDFSVNPMSM